MDEKIILHTSHCPRCIILEKKLKEKGVEYVENNDVQVMIDKGLEMAPALEVEGKIMKYAEAIKWINNYNKE